MFIRLCITLVISLSGISALQIKIPKDAKKILRQSGITEKEAKNLIKNNSSDILTDDSNSDNPGKKSLNEIKNTKTRYCKKH